MWMRKSLHSFSMKQNMACSHDTITGMWKCQHWKKDVSGEFRQSIKRKLLWLNFYMWKNVVA